MIAAEFVSHMGNVGLGQMSHPGNVGWNNGNIDLRLSRKTNAPVGAFVAMMLMSSPAVGDGVLLSDLVRETQTALLWVGEAAESSNLPPLRAAVLKVNAIQSSQAGGGLRLFVVQIGGGVETEGATTLELTLVPPPPGTDVDVSPLQLARPLADAILAVSHAISEAEQGNPPLVASEAVASIRFGLVHSGEGGLKIAFPPFEAAAEGAVKQETIQEVTVTYGATK